MLRPQKIPTKMKTPITMGRLSLVNKFERRLKLNPALIRTRIAKIIHADNSDNKKYLINVRALFFILISPPLSFIYDTFQLILRVVLVKSF